MTGQYLTIGAPVDRWTPKRKRQLVHAVVSGDYPREALLKMYGVSVEEFRLWRRNLAKRGLDGLAVTKIQDGARA